MEDDSYTCWEEPSAGDLSLGIFLIVGTVVTYIPQYVVIIKRKTSSGLSSFMIGLTFLGSALTVINSCILTWPKFVCCKSLSFGNCLANNLASEQFLVSLVSTWILLPLFLKYAPRHTAQERWFFRMNCGVFGLITTLAVTLSLIAAALWYILGYSANTLFIYATALGYISSINQIIMYTPQIYTTFKAKSGGSLSVASLCMQIPGSILVIVFQGVLNHAPFSTWVPYVFAAIEQFILVVMIFLYKHRTIVAKKKREEIERASLLNFVDNQIQFDSEDMLPLDQEKKKIRNPI